MPIAAKDTDQVTEKTMTVNVLYFASLADKAKCNEESVTVPQSTSLIELYEQLSAKHGFNHLQSELKVAVNDYFGQWTDSIENGDSVVFITPVAGG